MISRFVHDEEHGKNSYRNSYPIQSEHHRRELIFLYVHTRLKTRVHTQKIKSLLRYSWCSTKRHCILCFYVIERFYLTREETVTNNQCKIATTDEQKKNRIIT